MIACAVAASLALALGEAPPGPGQAVAPVGLVLDGALGYGDGWYHTGSYLLEIAPRVRVAAVELGGVAAAAADDLGLFDTTREDTYLGLLAGYRVRLEGAVELELLAEGGYHGVGLKPSKGMFSGPSTSASFGYLGGRAGADRRFGDRLRVIWVIVRSDLSPRRVVGLESPGLFATALVPHDYGVVGGTAVFVALRFGVELGLGGADAPGAAAP